MKQRVFLSIISISFLLIMCISVRNTHRVKKLYAQLTTHHTNTPNNTFSMHYLSFESQTVKDSTDLDIPKNEDLVFLDQTLKLIFPNGTNSLSDEEKSIEILKFVASTMILDNNSGSATKLLRDKVALCEGLSRVFVILSRKAAIPARQINICNAPMLGSHVASETFYDGSWHFFDPTFGIFFYSNLEFDKKGEIVSFQDLTTPPSELFPFQVVSQPWVGKYDEQVRTFLPQQLTVDYLKGKYKSIFIDGYQKDIKEAFPIAYNTQESVSFPVDMDLINKNNQWLGIINNSGLDLSLFKTRFMGSGYLGGYLSAFHTWTLKSPKSSIIHIEYYSTSDAPPKLQLIPLRAVRLLDITQNNKVTIFTLQTNDDYSLFSIVSPESLYNIDAIQAYR